MTLRTVVSLNTESGGRRGFRTAIKKFRSDPDLLALMLQEVHRAYGPGVPREIYPADPGKRGKNPIRGHLHDEIAEQLGSEFDGYFAPQLSGHLHDRESSDLPVMYGQSVFVRRGTGAHVVHHTSGCVYRNHNQANSEAEGGLPSAKSMIALTLQLDTGPQLTLGNVHGFWSHLGKVDMASRLDQNRGIATMLRQHGGCHPGGHFDAKVLLMGDLNYTSEMQALAHLRSDSAFGVGGGVILNHTYGITRTRSDHYERWREVPEADFAIASQRLAPHVTTAWVDLMFPSDHGAYYVTVDL